MRWKRFSSNPLVRSSKPLRFLGLVQASQTEPSCTITLIGVRTCWARVRRPWNRARALVCGPGAMPVMVPFRISAPTEKVWTQSAKIHAWERRSYRRTVWRPGSPRALAKVGVAKVPGLQQPWPWSGCSTWRWSWGSFGTQPCAQLRGSSSGS